MSSLLESDRRVTRARLPRRFPAPRVLLPHALALGLGVVGALLFLLIGTPLPWLLGPLTVCLIAAVAKLPVRQPARAIGDPMRAVLGLAVGTAFTPQLLNSAADVVLSLMFVPLFVVAAGAIGVPFFRRLAGFDPATAFFSAMPGGFNDMIVMGHDAGADVRKLSLVHSTRVLLIVFVLPFWLQWSRGLAPAGPDAGAGAAFGGSEAVPELALLGLAGLVGWWLAARVGLSGAAIVGPMVASALLHITGLLDAGVPPFLINLAQLVIGVGIGCQFRGVTVREFFGTIAFGIGYTAILFALTALTVAAVIAVTGAHQSSAVLAFAPGGQAEMNLMALLLNVEPAYVALHHLLRLALVIIGAQLVFAQIGERRLAAAKRKDRR